MAVIHRRKKETKETKSIKVSLKTYQRIKKNAFYSNKTMQKFVNDAVDAYIKISIFEN